MLFSAKIPLSKDGGVATHKKYCKQKRGACVLRLRGNRYVSTLKPDADNADVGIINLYPCYYAAVNLRHFFVCERGKKMKNKNLVKIVLSALLIALGTVLSEVVPSVSLPFGGSITVFSMVPMCLLGYMFGVKWGVFANLVYGAVQMMFGLNNLSYATWWGAAVVIVLFDYIVAYGVLGFSGVFKGKIKNEFVACLLGVLLAVFLRYVCHFITGVTVWREVADLWGAIWFSITYNGAYMIPEMVITPLGVALLYKANVLKRISK